jgi:putative aldouronate transport system substrate-binding protein
VEAMKFYKKLYDEKLINQDFAVVKDGRQVFNKGTAGVWIANMNDGQGMEETVKKVIPAAAVTMVNGLEGPAGMRSAGGSGSYGIFMMPKTTVKDGR